MTTDSEMPRHELQLVRLISARPELIYRAWTEPELLKRWFCPRPWMVSHAELDVRPGGHSLIVMRSPEGEEFENRGVYLEVIHNERLVFTDAYTRAWMPSDKPFMTGIITLSPEPAGTRYSATVRHWSAEDMQTHEAMGFHEGWGKATDQLEELVQNL